MEQSFGSEFPHRKTEKRYPGINLTRASGDAKNTGGPHA